MSDLTQHISEFCIDLLVDNIRRTLDSAPDYLSHLAEQTSFENERSVYIGTMHELRFSDKKVFSVMQSEIHKPFELLKRGVVPKEFQREGGIIRNVTGATELEEKLALETMLSKAQSRSEIPLINISRTLDALMGTDWVKRNYNPLDPEFIIRAWVMGTHQLQTHAHSFLGLYALLDSELLSKLNSIYEKIINQIDILSTQGLQHSHHSTASHSTSETDDFEAMFGDIDSISPDSSGHFLNSQYPVNKTSQEVSVTTDELIRKLTELQSNRALDDSKYYGSNYLLDSHALLNGEGLLSDGEVSATTIGEINNDILDMTQLMFSFLMEDYNIPDDIRYYISRLQIPYLKLGLIDRSLFQDKEHPGRNLLMELSQSINNWDPVHTSGIDQLVTEIIRIVDSVINSFDIDGDLLARSHREFKLFLEGDSHIDENMIQRQKSRETHLHRADNAKLIIEGALADICQNNRVPPIVEKILSEYWSKVLFIEFLKEGEGSKSYRAYLETAVVLVDSVQAKSSEQERKLMAKNLPEIVKRLKDGLNIISIASFESVDLFRELQRCHMEVLKERPESSEQSQVEVSDDAYASFKVTQNKTNIPWDRAAIEASMLEDNIERSIALSSANPIYADDNPNVIRQSKSDDLRETTTDRADRERSIIDKELKEAREAYELALKEHQDRKNQTSPAEDTTASNDDDFMSMFFQDPDFVGNQFKASHTEKPMLSESEKAFLDNELADKSITIKETVEQDIPAGLDADIDVPMDASGRAKGAEDIGKASVLHDDINELIERLKVGIWVDLYQHEGRKVRAKIMAIVPTVGKYIFGDRAGIKLADYNRQSLYEAIKTGQIQLTDVDTAYDKTLQSVISNLRVMKKAEDD